MRRSPQCCSRCIPFGLYFYYFICIQCSWMIRCSLDFNLRTLHNRYEIILISLNACEVLFIERRMPLGEFWVIVRVALPKTREMQYESSYIVPYLGTVMKTSSIFQADNDRTIFHTFSQKSVILFILQGF